MCLNKKRVSDLYRTATTAYPCSIPRLGEFCGSWSYKTYPTAKVQNFFVSTKNVGIFVVAICRMCAVLSSQAQRGDLPLFYCLQVLSPPINNI